MKKRNITFLIFLSTLLYSMCTSYAHDANNASINCCLSCGICGKDSEEFKSTKKVKKHIKENHPEVVIDINKYRKDPKDSKNFSCNKCDKSVKTRNGFRNHIHGIHLKIRHKCKSCGQIFAQKKAFKTHKCKEWLFVCRSCNTQSPEFDSEKELIKHIQDKHSEIDTNINNYKKKSSCPDKFSCNKCDHKDVCSERFNVHVKKNHLLTGYKCKECKKILKTRKGIAEHINLGKHQTKTKKKITPENNPEPAAEPKYLTSTSDLQSAIPEDFLTTDPYPLENNQIANPTLIIKLLIIKKLCENKLLIPYNLKTLFEDISEKLITIDSNLIYTCSWENCTKSFRDKQLIIAHILKDHLELTDQEIDFINQITEANSNLLSPAESPTKSPLVFYNNDASPEKSPKKESPLFSSADSPLFYNADQLFGPATNTDNDSEADPL